MALSSELASWTPAADIGGCAVMEDQCRASASAPQADWVYRDAAIGFVMSGWFEYRAQSANVLATPGSMVFGNSGEPFSVRHVDAVGNKRLVTLISESVLEEIADAANLDDTRFPVVALPASRDATRMFGWMRTVALGCPLSEDFVFPLACAALTATRERAPGRITTRDRERVRAAVDHIDTHYAEPCSLQTLAAVTNLSRYHFVRVFGAVMAQSPNQYLINTRLRAAADRLLTTPTPIAELAYDVGFNDISYFYGCFRHAFGCTPRQWRARAN